MASARKVVVDALYDKLFPPVIQKPEESRSYKSHKMLVSQLFSIVPFIVWIPEVRLKDGKPSCIRPTCDCKPTRNKYCCREVHDVKHVTRLYFVEYKCTKYTSKGDGKKTFTFNTISPSFLASLPRSISRHFPYLLTPKSGASHEVLRMVHRAVMQPKGMAPVLKEIDRIRRDRYFDLKECAYDLIDAKEALKQKAYFCPMSLLAITDYMKTHKVFESSYGYDLWMHFSSPFVFLDEQIKQSIEVLRCFRFDGTYKIGKKMIVLDESNRRVKPDESKVLLLLTNEIGQWTSFCFSDGEKNEDLKTMLKVTSHNVSSKMAACITN